MKLQKLIGYNRIFIAETFFEEFNALFGKDKGNRHRYHYWLMESLKVLDRLGIKALRLAAFEKLEGVYDPPMYAIRHARSAINERHIYVYAEDENVVLLASFFEKKTSDYERAIEHAANVYQKLFEEVME